MEVIEDADAGRLDRGEQPALPADKQLLRAKRPSPRLFEDPSVHAELKVGVNVYVERRILDLNAARAAHVGAGQALRNRVENGEVVFLAICWLRAALISL